MISVFKKIFSISFVFFLGLSLAVKSYSNTEWDALSVDEDEYFFYGFAETLGGKFTDENVVEDSISASELRFQFSGNGDLGNVYSSFKFDSVKNFVSGDSDFSVRELYFDYEIFENVDIRFGRQVISVGTGDQVFLNDTFAKDFVSLFSGRELDYLKVPTDLLKLTFNNVIANAEFIWNPNHQPDNFIDGSRFSYFDVSSGEIVAFPTLLRTDAKEDDEYWFRTFKNVNGYELAAYLFKGRYKQPLGASGNGGNNFFPKMRNIGFSVRGAVDEAIVNFEISHYTSLEDRSGVDPFIPNSQTRALLGYEFEISPKFTWSSQYYLEYIRDYDALLRFSLDASLEQEEKRHALSTKLTYKLLQDKLTLSTFAMSSVNEKDLYIDANASYRYSDKLSYSVGFDIFSGGKKHTRFGMLQGNDNVYFRIRLFI